MIYFSKRCMWLHFGGTCRLFGECCVTSVTLSHADERGTMAAGPQTLPEDVATVRRAKSLPRQRSSLSPPCPAPPTKANLRLSKSEPEKKTVVEGLACPKTSLSAPERFCSPEESGAGGWGWGWGKQTGCEAIWSHSSLDRC